MIVVVWRGNYKIAVSLNCHLNMYARTLKKQCVHRTLHHRSHFHNFDLLLKIFRYINKIFEFLKTIIWPCLWIISFIFQKRIKCIWLHSVARNAFSSGICKKWCCASRTLMHTTTVMKIDRPDWFDSSPCASLCHSHATSCSNSGIVEWKQMNRSLKYLYSKYEDV